MAWRSCWIDSARNLALLRIALMALILISPETWIASAHAAMPAELRVVPEGLRSFFALVPIDPWLASRAQMLLVAAAVLGLFGITSRFALGVVTVTGLYVFGLAQLSGSVLHDMHLLWFSALLALSPCGDALALDTTWRRPRQVPPDATGLAYGVPLQCVRMLLAVIYFFPGFWKLRSSGLDWIFSDNLRNQLYWKWYQHGVVPTLRVDQTPALLTLGALAVVAFELSFIALIWSRRTRRLAGCAGLAFHAATELFMFIPFSSLWACYVVLFDVSGLLNRQRGQTVRSAPAPLVRTHWQAAGLLGALLIAAAATQGARGAMQAWPFACYPTFQWRVPDRIADLRIEAVFPDGTLRPIPDGPATGGHRSQAAWASAWQVAGLYGVAASPAELRAYWEELRRTPPAAAAASGATTLRFYLAYYAVVPERWTEPPLQRHLLGEIALP